MKLRRVSGGVVIKFIQGKQYVLLIQRAPDDHFPLRYEFPRGGCDANESIYDTVKREIKEETNLDVELKKLIDTTEYINNDKNQKNIQFNFLCKRKNPNQEVVLSHEHSDYKWVESVGELELMLNTDVRKTITKVFEKFRQLINYDFEDYEEDKHKISE